MKKSEKTEITISKIIEAAMNEFGKNGYVGGTVNRICNSGINKGLLYHNFSGKNELYLICLKRSCQQFMGYVQKQNATDSLENYMAARLDFFHAYPNESHIFFEALLSPPPELAEEVNEALSEFMRLNEKLYDRTLGAIILRDGIAKEDALSYFHLMQTMLNGYFSSPAFQNMNLQKKVEIHEMIVPKLLDYMLYGIAKGEK